MYQRKLRVWGFKKNKKRETDRAPEQENSGRYDFQKMKTPTVYSAPVFKQPGLLDGPEKFLQAVSNTQSSFTTLEIKDGVPEPLDDQEILHYSFNPQIAHGIILMRDGRCKTGGALIERGLQLTKIVLNRRDPHLLYILCCHVFSMTIEKLHGLAEIYTRFIHQASYNILGQDHHFTFFTKLLYQNRDSWAIGEGIRVVHQATHEIAGPADMLTLSAYKIMIVYLVNSPTPFEEVCYHYETLIQMHEKYSKKRWRGILGTKGDYATYLTSMNKISKALTIYQQVCSVLFDDPPPVKEVSLILIPHCVKWAKAIMKEPIAEGFEEDEISHNKRYVEVETLMKNTIEKAILILGPNDTETIYACEYLAKFYTQYGSPEKSQVQLDFVSEQIAALSLDDESSQS